MQRLVQHPQTDGANARPEIVEPNTSFLPRDARTTRERARRARRRRAAKIAGLAVAAVLVAALAAAVFLTYRDGQAWKNRAHSWQSRAEALDQDLQASEAEVGALEARVDGLATEKAQAQDERDIAANDRDLYLAVAAMATQVVDDLARCQESVDRTLSATISQLGSQWVAWSTLQSLAAHSDAVCATADDSYRELADAINSL